MSDETAFRHSGRVTIEFRYEEAAQQRVFERGLMDWLKPITVVNWQPPRWELSEATSAPASPAERYIVGPDGVPYGPFEQKG